MAGLFKHFQLQPLPSNEETGLGEGLTKEVNAAMERVLEKEQNGAEDQKRKYSLSQQSKQQREADTQPNVALLCQSVYSTNPA